MARTVKIIVRVLVLLAFAIFNDVAAVKDGVELSETFGGPHGMVFTDEASASPGQIVNTITIRAGERVDGLAMQITTAAGGTMTFTHGGMGGDENSLTLGEGEYITSMEAHWAEKNSHTRIFYLSFGTSAGNTVSGGGQTENVGKVTAPEGYQLSGFHGQDGNEIDLLGAIWTSIKPLEEAPGTVAPADIPGSTSGSTSATVDVPVGGSTAASGSAAKQTQGSAAAPAANVAPEDTSGSDAPEPAPRTAGIKLSEAFGGPHGEQFSDQPSAASGVTVGSITVRGGERIDGLKLEITAPTPLTLAHGGSGGTDNTLTLAAGEHVTSMDINVGQKKGRTRIFYLKFTTNLGNSVEAGGTTGERSSVTAPDGYQLSGFFGRVGDEIDKLGIIWTSIEKVEAAPTTAPALTDEDIVLGELFGGPHGNAFSDINYIVLQQTTSSITIRGADRVDAVTLQVATPAERSLTHGGTGGTENTLTFGPGEYITSMEAHWDKKNKHTRIFYLSFTTNKDNTLSAGSPTDNKGTATAPEGFQLSGFFGRGGDEIDQLGAIWTKVGAKSVSLLDDTGIGAGTYGTTIRNWVGPTIGDATDKACYRKTEPYNSNEICPLGYSKDDDDCITRCPLAYPVSCGAECLRQNDDCAMNILTKIFSVVAVALNAATGGVFGQILLAFKAAKLIITCAANVISVVQSLTRYMRNQQMTGPQSTAEELLDVAYQSDVVLVDVPVAICSCLGIPVPAGAKFADTVITISENVAKQVITNGDQIMSDAKSFLNFLTDSVTINSTDTEVSDLQDLMDKNSSCGWELKRLTDRVIFSVNRLREVDPDMSVNDIRVNVSKSSTALLDIPIVTNNCMGELLSTKTTNTAYQTRDLLRKTFGIILDQLIETATTDLGKSVSADDYMISTANMGLTILSAIDPTGIAYMAAQFVQPTCGPTAYLGEIDDGTLFDALGLTTVDEAFEGSYGTWTKTGDGVATLIFESTDTKDVTVVVHSGGDTYAEVDVGAGDTVTWTAMIPELEDKTMYLDRWRPGLFGLPGSGGGSLLLWMPRSPQLGHLTMHVRINVS